MSKDIKYKVDYSTLRTRQVRGEVYFNYAHVQSPVESVAYTLNPYAPEFYPRGWHAETADAALEEREGVGEGDGKEDECIDESVATKEKEEGVEAKKTDVHTENEDLEMRKVMEMKKIMKIQKDLMTMKKEVVKMMEEALTKSKNVNGDDVRIKVVDRVKIVDEEIKKCAENEVETGARVEVENKEQKKIVVYESDDADAEEEKEEVVVKGCCAVVYWMRNLFRRSKGKE